MTSEQLSNIEKNIKFKRYICAQELWKNYALVPPFIVLFGSLFGLIYLLNTDMLISWYSVPSVILFILGTIWFKFTRRFLIEKKSKEITSIKICVPTFLDFAEERNIYFFTASRNRNNSVFADKEKLKLFQNEDFENFVHTYMPKNSYLKPYLYKEDKFLFRKKNKQNIKFIAFINNEIIKIISRKVLAKYK